VALFDPTFLRKLKDENWQHLWKGDEVLGKLGHVLIISVSWGNQRSRMTRVPLESSPILGFLENTGYLHVRTGADCHLAF